MAAGVAGVEGVARVVRVVRVVGVVGEERERLEETSKLPVMLQHFVRKCRAYLPSPSPLCRPPL